MEAAWLAFEAAHSGLQFKPTHSYASQPRRIPRGCLLSRAAPQDCACFGGCRGAPTLPPPTAGRSRLHPIPRAQRFGRPTLPAFLAGQSRREDVRQFPLIFFLGARSQSCPRYGLPLANGGAEPVSSLPLPVLLEAPSSGLVSQSVLQRQRERRAWISPCSRGAFFASVDPPVTRAQQAEMFWLVATVGVAVAVGFLLLLLIYVVSPIASPKPLSLSGAHVVITGGSSGIGKGIAIECFKQGAFITLLARNENRLLEAKKEIEQYSVNDKQVVHVISVDVSQDCAHVAKVLKQAQEKLGPVDMLVNCAGTSVNGRFEELDTRKFEQLMAVNYLGTVYPTRAVVPTMKERRMGRIVFVSSQAGQIGVFGYSAYSATKFALRGLAEALQMEVKPYNIYITVAYPPDTDTPGYAEESKSKLLETQLISESSTVCQPDHVARIIVKDAIQGKSSSSVGTDGRMLTILTAGVSPVTSIAEALEMVILIGCCRLVSLYYLTSFDSIIRRCMLQKEKSQKAD